MGTPLTELLADRGHEVLVTSRKIRRSHRHNVSYLQGNAKDLDFLRKITDKQHFDAIVDFMSYTTAEFKGRYEWLLSHTDQYLFTSSARVFAPIDSPIKEDSPRLLDVCKDEAYLRTDEYALAKARQEDLLRQSGQTNWTIIRPSITYNDYRLQMGAFDKEDWLYRSFHGRSIVISRDVADKKTAMTHGSDLTKVLANMIGRKEALTRAFNIASEKSYTWQEILDFYLEVLEQETGSRPKVFMGEQSIKMKDGGKYQVMYARSLNRSFDATAIRQFADPDAFLDPKEGLQTALRNFLKAPRFDSINWRHEAWNDMETGEITPLSEIPSMAGKVEYFCYRHKISIIYRALRKVKKIIKKLI